MISYIDLISSIDIELMIKTKEVLNMKLAAGDAKTWNLFGKQSTRLQAT